MTADVRVYAKGIAHASVCVPDGQDDDRTVAHLNTVGHPGTTHGWQVSTDVTFATGQPNPCQCDEDPRRKHLLLSC